MTQGVRQLLASCVALAASASLARGQGFAPEEAVRHIVAPDGLRAKLVACEPMIVQPVAIEFDDRGRMWVVQYLQYPNPAGLTRVSVDRYSRTKYDRVPEPPPRGPKGGDRVTILEDADGDGRADAAKDFVAGLNLASGVAFGHGGVYILQPPYLLFYPDRDRDDAPDGDPEVLLTGFGMEDAHSVANSLIWGPDGWLYGVQGSTVTANIRGIEFQQGVWRFHPITKEFELFAEGGGNMWGLDYDEHGEFLASTNFGPYVMLHPVQGGYYWKSFGKHGELHNPHAYGYFDHVTQHDPQGGHVTDGGIVYQGGSFPPKFNGKYIASNLLSHAVYWHRLERTGSTFESYHEGVLLDSHDTWFAPSDVTTGPDGSVYVADWFDRRTAHPDPDADWDRSNGRVYKIEAEGTKPVAARDFRTLPTKELVGLLGHPNAWFRRRSRVQIAERRDPAINEALKRQIAGRGDDRLALESLWALYVNGGFDAVVARETLQHPNPDLRKWAVRFIGEEKALQAGATKELIELAATEPDVMTRSQLAQTARRLPREDALALAEKLLARGEDAEDAHIPLLLWWAVERHSMPDPEPALKRFATAEAWKTPMTRDEIIPRLARRYAAEGSAKGDDACVRLLGSAPNADATRRLVVALDLGLNERGGSGGAKPLGNLYEEYAVAKEEAPAAGANSKSEEVSTRLKAEIITRWEGDPSDAATTRLAARLGHAPALERALKVASDATAPVEVRRAMLEIAGQSGKADCVAPLLKLVFARDAAAINVAALDAVRKFPDDRVADSLLKGYAASDDAMQSRIRDALFGRAVWSRRFLAAVEKGELVAPDVPLAQLRKIALHGDAEMNAIVTKRWGAVKEGTPEDKLATMRRLNNDLRADKGNPAAGKETFTRLCAVCHTLHGEGNKVGPDLTQSNRLDTDFLLASMVDPSATIRKEYIPVIIETKDGRVLNGLVADRTPGSVTLVDAKNEKTAVNMGEVKEMRDSSVSIMPEDLLKDMKPEEFRNLFAYLQSEPPARAGK